MKILRVGGGPLKIFRHPKGGSEKITTIKASDTLNTNPGSGQYLTHAHSHITQAVAAMDSCFGLVRPYQHGMALYSLPLVLH